MRNSQFVWLLLSFAALLGLIQVIDYLNFTVDDVFISLRVAENVARGAGFVYTPNDYVEGYSNWLWIVVLGALLKTGLSSFSPSLSLLWGAKILSLLSGIATAILLYTTTKRLLAGQKDRRVYAALSALLLVSCGPFILWSTSGLETVFVSFLYLGQFSAGSLLIQSGSASNGKKNRSAVLLASSMLAAALIRPEGIVIDIIVLIWLFLLIDKSDRKLVFLTAIVFVLSYAAFLVWRLNTYGDIVPNTYYAKTGGGIQSYGMGLKYYLSGIGTTIGALLLFFPFVFFRTESAMRKVLLFGLSFVAGVSLFTIYSGGDWMPGARFLVPIVPILIFAGVFGIARCVSILTTVISASVRRAAAVIVCLFLIAQVLSERTLIRGQVSTMHSGFKQIIGHSQLSHYQVALWLHEHATPGSLFAAGEAGIIGYLNPTLKLLDMNGLMDKQIARDMKAGQPFSTAYILDRKPDFILLYGNIEWSYYFSALLNDPRFLAEYRLVTQFTQFEEWDIYQRK